jgi:hypothetical protein
VYPYTSCVPSIVSIEIASDLRLYFFLERHTGKSLADVLGSRAANKGDGSDCTTEYPDRHPLSGR